MSRTQRVRSISLVLIGMMLGAVMTAPAFAYHTPNHTKKQVAKVRKALVKKIDAAAAAADAKFEPTGTITTFGQVKMNVGDPDKVLATVGPFSWVAQCRLSGGNDLIAQILITTSEANSFYSAGYASGPLSGGTKSVGIDYDLDPGDVDKVWAGGDLMSPPGTASDWSWDNNAHAGAPSGVMVDGESIIFTDVAGANCVFSGHITRTA